jgi:hypothetical protein
MAEFQIPPGWTKNRAIVGYLQAISRKAAAVADLDQTISNPPTQAEVQAISDKLDELLAALRTAEKLKT